MSEEKKMTPKQQLFVAEYLVDLNATQAAIRAGYSPKTAYSQGERLLKNVEVSSAIQAAMEKRVEKTEITAQRVLDEISKLSFSDIRKFFDENGNLLPVHMLSDDAAAAISSIEVVTKVLPGRGEGESAEVEYIHKIKTWDKRGSLELLGRHLKLFREQIDLNVLANVSDEELQRLEEDEARKIAIEKGWIKG